MKVNKPLLAISMMTLAVIGNGVKDGFAKVMAGGITPTLLLFIQLSVTALVLFFLVVRDHKTAVLRPDPLGGQLIRALGMVMGIGFFYWAVHFIPVADSTAVTFIAPLLVTAFSPLILSEHVGLRRWTAVVIGFAGILLILRPGFEGALGGYIIAIGSGAGIAIFYLMNRKLAGHVPALLNVFYANLLGAIILVPTLPFTWPEVFDVQTWVLAAFLWLAIQGQVLMISAFIFGQGATVATFQYIQIISASAAGYVLFGDLPDWLSWIGIALVVGAGIYVAFRESRIKREPPRQQAFPR